MIRSSPLARHGLAHLASLLVGAVLLLSGLLAPLDLKLGDMRMALTPRAASGQVAFVAIDAHSLQEVGIWPWPRSVHAELLDRLTEAGAGDVFFDIDFELPADPAEDAALAAALERAGGTTLLAAFAQRARATPAPGTPLLHVNMPQTAFLDRAWPVLVNVWPDPDGVVRDYAYGGMVGGADLPTAAAMIAGRFGPPGTGFGINYGIAPETIPTHSAADILAGAVPDEAIAGRAVIVGAHALELSDSFAVPVHGVLPGPLVHALATETLAAGIALRPVARGLPLALLAALLVPFCLGAVSRNPWLLLGALCTAAVAAEIVALVAFRGGALILPTAAIHAALLVHVLRTLARQLDLGRLLLRRKDMEIDDTRRLLARVFQDSSDAIAVVDAAGTPIAGNDLARTLFAGPEGAIRLPDSLWNEAARVIAAARAGTWSAAEPLELSVDRPGGRRSLQVSITPSRMAAVDGPGRGTADAAWVASISARDITELRLQEAQLRYLSKFDERTGALRRNGFLEELAAQIAGAPDTTVYALNLARLRDVNLTFGRGVGDRLLVAVVSRLGDAAPELSPVVRTDGNTFAVFSRRQLGVAAAAETARSIAATISEPYEIDGMRIRIDARVGYAGPDPEADTGAEARLTRAEEALETARGAAGRGVARFDPSDAARDARRREIEHHLPDAIARDELFLLYQPQIDLRDGRLAGVEALIRWTSPDLGEVPVFEFIAVAEATGLIAELGRWALHRACADARALPEDVEMAVNISTVQMRHANLVGDVAGALRASGLAPDRLCLELTESVFLDQSACAVEVMRDIELLGPTWALDDFGTGYSSFAYLSNLPLRKLKLDQHFIRSAPEDPTSRAIIRAAATLCDGAGMTLLCEGVETAEHVALLRGEGVHLVQGYHFGKPMPLDRIVAGCTGTGAAAAR